MTVSDPHCAKIGEWFSPALETNIFTGKVRTRNRLALSVGE